MSRDLDGRRPRAVRRRRRQRPRRPPQRLQRRRIQLAARRRSSAQQEQQAIKADPAEPEQRRRPGPTWSRRAGPPPGRAADFNSSTGQFTKSGLNELSLATQAWQQYLKLTKNPDPNLAILAARAYAGQQNYAGEASAWDIETLADPTAVKGFECLAVSAYAAGQTRKGDLASAKALSMVPKAQQALLKNQHQPAKTQPSVAQQC